MCWCLFFTNCGASPCRYKQETSRSGFPWWLRWSPRVPGSARPPGTTAGRTRTHACLQTPETTSEVSLWSEGGSMCSGYLLQTSGGECRCCRVFRQASVSGSETIWFTAGHTWCNESQTLACNTYFKLLYSFSVPTSSGADWDSVYDSAAGCGEMCLTNLLLLLW